MSIESVVPSNHLILCSPLVLLPSIFPSIRVFSNESALYIWWPKYWSFGLISLQSKGLSRVFSSTTVQKHQFFNAQSSLWFNSHICTGKTIALTIWTFVGKVMSLLLNMLSRFVIAFHPRSQASVNFMASGPTTSWQKMSKQWKQ